MADYDVQGPAWGRARAIVVAAGQWKRAVGRGGRSGRRTGKQIDKTGWQTGKQKEEVSGRMGIRRADGRADGGTGRAGKSWGQA